MITKGIANCRIKNTAMHTFQMYLEVVRTNRPGNHDFLTHSRLKLNLTHRDFQ